MGSREDRRSAEEKYREQRTFYGPSALLKMDFMEYAKPQTNYPFEYDNFSLGHEVLDNLFAQAQQETEDFIQLWRRASSNYLLLQWKKRLQIEEDE